MSEKYLTFKRDEFEKWMSGTSTPGMPQPLGDAVVIRRQDVFAPPALDAYASALMCVVETLCKVKRGAEVRDEKPDRPMDYTTTEVIDRLKDVADYFHHQASLAWQTERKLPD